MTVETDIPGAAASKPGGLTIAVSNVEPTMTSPQIEIREGLGNAARVPGPVGSAKDAGTACRGRWVIIGPGARDIETR
jgi:hypothetical protein